MPFSHNVIHKETIQETWSHTDFNLHVDDLWETIQSPGVPRDGIPPLDNPHFQSVNDATHVFSSSEGMIVVVGENERKAYRVDDVMLHEIVNDSLDGKPIAVTFCPLCNSAVVYKRTIGNEVLRLGVSGMLRHNDLVMWDDVSESWWQQMTGEAIAGKWTGQHLEMVSSLILSMGQVASQYPDAKVLLKTSKDPIPPLHQTGDFKERGSKMVDTAKIFASFIQGFPVAIDFELLRRKRVLNQEFQDLPFVVIFNPSVSDMGIEVNDSQGQALMYVSKGSPNQRLQFHHDGENRLKDLETGSEWTIFGKAISGPLIGTELEKVMIYPHFKKPWFQFHPNAVYVKS